MEKAQVGQLYNLVHKYQLSREMGGHMAIEPCGTFIIISDLQMARASGHGKFSETPQYIPRSDSYEFLPIEDTAPYFEPEPPKPKIEGALEFEEWLKHMKSKELTVADIEAMKPGEQLRVIQLHRNLGDMVLDGSVNPYGVAIPAVKFFESVGGLYTHGHDLHGRLIDVPDECDCGENEFNFHLNFKGKNWYPLNDDGLLPIKDGEYMVQGALEDYRKYPKTTKVGMRGPMLKLSDVEKAPPVYHYKEEFFW